MALFHLGTSKEISNIDASSETSEEARTLRVFWDLAREKCLTGFAWPFAKKVQALSLIEEDPTDEWGYSYAYPSDAASINKIQSGLEIDTRSSVIPYDVANNGDTKLIYTNEVDAVAEYTLNLTSTAAYTSEFVEALSYLLASYSAMKLARSNQEKMKSQLYSLYKLSLDQAKSNSINETQSVFPVEADIISGR